MNKAEKYVVRLSDEEQEEIKAILKKGRASAYIIKHANILQKADENGLRWADSRIAEAFGCTVQTVHWVRKRFVERGLQGALERKKQDRLSRARIIDGEKEARLIALACSKPPEGRASWSLHLLSEKLVELKIVESISHETVRQALKKMNLSLT